MLRVQIFRHEFIFQINREIVPMKLSSNFVFSAYFCLVLIPAGGCVTKSRFEELEAQKKKLEEQKNAEILGLQQKLSSSEQNQQALSKDSSQKIDTLKKQMSEKEQKELLLKNNLKDMQAALAESAQRKAEVEKRVAEFKGLLQKFKSLRDAGKLNVKIVEGRMVVGIGTDILFPSGSARLSKEGKEAIKEVAKTLASIEDKKFQVEGHTDNVPMKGSITNWELASNRANNVRAELESGGMKPEQVSIASYAETKPIQSNDKSEGKSANRRIEIVVMPDLSLLPGFEELKKIDTAEK
jgi:chemotaxis protein MotB